MNGSKLLEERLKDLGAQCFDTVRSQHRQERTTTRVREAIMRVKGTWTRLVLGLSLGAFLLASAWIVFLPVGGRKDNLSAIVIHGSRTVQRDPGHEYLDYEFLTLRFLNRSDEHVHVRFPPVTLEWVDAITGASVTVSDFSQMPAFIRELTDTVIEPHDEFVVNGTVAVFSSRGYSRDTLVLTLDVRPEEAVEYVRTKYFIRFDRAERK